MALWYLINTVRVGMTKHKSGSTVDDAATDAALIVAAGGKLISTSVTALAAPAAIATNMWRNGKSQEECDAVMLAAYQVAKDTVDNTTAVNQNEGAHTHAVGGATPAIAALAMCGHASFTNPVAAALTGIVATVDCANGPQVIAAQPDYPRKLQLRMVEGGAAITAGTCTVVGFGSNGEALSQAIDITGGTKTVVTNDAYATVTSATVAGQVGGGAGTTIGIGPGNALALPIPVSAGATAVSKAIVDSANEAVGTVDAVARTIEPTTAPNAAHDYDFYFTYTLTPTQAAHDHGAVTGAGSAHTHVQTAHNHTLS